MRSEEEEIERGLFVTRVFMRLLRAERTRQIKKSREFESKRSALEVLINSSESKMEEFFSDLFDKGFRFNNPSARHSA